jgi:hypothetical protein
MVVPDCHLFLWSFQSTISTKKRMYVVSPMLDSYCDWVENISSFSFLLGRCDYVGRLHPRVLPFRLSEEYILPLATHRFVVKFSYLHSIPVRSLDCLDPEWYSKTSVLLPRFRQTFPSFLLFFSGLNKITAF